MLIYYNFSDKIRRIDDDDDDDPVSLVDCRENCSEDKDELLSAKSKRSLVAVGVSSSNVTFRLIFGGSLILFVAVSICFLFFRNSVASGLPFIIISFEAL
jgi:hypothetical protein